MGVTLLFVSKQDYAKTTRPIFTEFSGKVHGSHGSRKRLLDFGGNPVHVMLRLGLRED